MKGTISDSLQAILRDDEGRKQLRSLLKKTEGKVVIGDTHYRVSTKNSGHVHVRDTEKSTVRDESSSLKRRHG
jgi:IS1 family transposase